MEEMEENISSIMINRTISSVSGYLTTRRRILGDSVHEEYLKSHNELITFFNKELIGFPIWLTDRDSVTLISKMDIEKHSIKVVEKEREFSEWAFLNKKVIAFSLTQDAFSSAFYYLISGDEDQKNLAKQTLYCSCAGLALFNYACEFIFDYAEWADSGDKYGMSLFFNGIWSSIVNSNFPHIIDDHDPERTIPLWLKPPISYDGNQVYIGDSELIDVKEHFNL